MKKKTFVAYSDWYQFCDWMSVEEKANLFDCIRMYTNWCERIEPLQTIKFVWNKIKATIDSDAGKREEKSAINRYNARKRREAKKGMQNDANAYEWIQTDYDTVTDTVTDTDTVTKNEIVPNDTTLKKKVIINKNNKEPAVKIYDYLKKLTGVIDGDLNDCVYLHYKLEDVNHFGGTTIEKLEQIIPIMIDKWLSKYYSISSPSKLCDNLGTIVSKIATGQFEQEQENKQHIYIK